MKRNWFILFSFLLVSCATFTVKINDTIYDVDTNHLSFDFSQERQDYIIINNQTNQNINVTYLEMGEFKDFVPAEEWNWNGIFHSVIEPGNGIETKNIGKCTVEIANGHVLKYSISYFTNSIVLNIVEFEQRDVLLWEKGLDTWTVSLLNGLYNSKFAKEEKYILWVSFYFNDLLNTIVVNIKDLDEQSSALDYELCEDFINLHPEIRNQTKPTKDLYKFIFEQSKENKFFLTEIESFDWENLRKYEKLKETHVIYDNLCFKKVDNTIKDDVILLDLRNPNFLNNNPYGFRKDSYYRETGEGYVLQWINENTCLYYFASRELVYYGHATKALSLIRFDSEVDNYPFGKNVLYHYEGVYTYITSNGSQNSIPIFRVIFDNESIDTRKSISVSEVEYISYNSSFFLQNNPYGLNRNTKYIESAFFGGEVLQWLDDGCLYDFSKGLQDVYWSCLVYLILPESDRNLFFDGSYTKYYKYEGVYSYETVNHSVNTVPKLRVYFEKR